MANVDPIQKDLGLVTAYGYALAGGYTGSEEQFKKDFAALMSGQYTALSNKPSINGVELTGNKTSSELGLAVQGQYADGDSNGNALHAKDIDIRDRNNVHSGVIGHGGWNGYEGTEINGIRIDMEHDADYLDFGARETSESAYYSTKLIYVGPNADDTWVSDRSYTKNRWHMSTDLDMRGHTIYNANIDGMSGGTSNYNELSNLPQINGVTLTGNKTAADLGISGGGGVSVNITDITDAWSVDAGGGSYFTDREIKLYRYDDKMSMVDFRFVIKKGTKFTAGTSYRIGTCLGQYQNYVAPIKNCSFDMPCIVGQNGDFELVGVYAYAIGVVSLVVTKSFTAGEDEYNGFTTPCFFNRRTS